MKDLSVKDVQLAAGRQKQLDFVKKHDLVYYEVYLYFDPDDPNLYSTGDITVLYTTNYFVCFKVPRYKISTYLWINRLFLVHVSNRRYNPIYVADTDAEIVADISRITGIGLDCINDMGHSVQVTIAINNCTKEKILELRAICKSVVSLSVLWDPNRDDD